MRSLFRTPCLFLSFMSLISSVFLFFTTISSFFSPSLWFSHFSIPHKHVVFRISIAISASIFYSSLTCIYLYFHLSHSLFYLFITPIASSICHLFHFIVFSINHHQVFICISIFIIHSILYSSCPFLHLPLISLTSSFLYSSPPRIFYISIYLTFVFHSCSTPCQVPIH